MKVSIIIPVYNERDTILQVHAAVQMVELDKEIIIVDDGSTDGTRDLLTKLAEQENTRVIFHDRNQGKSAALRTGFNSIAGDVVIVQDADLEYDPFDYFKLLKPIQEEKADVVYGSRFIGGEQHRVHLFWHMLGNKFLTLLFNMLTNLNLTDMETRYKAFKSGIGREIKINENRFGFEPEITAKIAKLNIRIYEVGISYAGRTYKEGKKIGWENVFSALRCILSTTYSVNHGLDRT